MIPELIFHQHEAMMREWERGRAQERHPAALASVSHPAEAANVASLSAALRAFLRWLGAAPARNHPSD